MFINSKKNFEIIGEGGKLIIPRGFIGSIPDWAALHTGWFRPLSVTDLLQHLRASQTGRLRKRMKVRQQRQMSMTRGLMELKARDQQLTVRKRETAEEIGRYQHVWTAV